jgi:hypothetical protein
VAHASVPPTILPWNDGGCPTSPRSGATTRSDLPTSARSRAGEHFAIAGWREDAGFLLFHFPTWCAYRKLYPAIMMMKSAEDRLSSELAQPLDGPMARRIFVQE